MHDLDDNMLPFKNWADFRIFLAIKQTGSFSRAAEALKLTQPTVSRRMESLETQLGVRLFDRLPSGVELTQEALQIVESAEAIQNAIFDIQRKIGLSDRRMEGTVRISVTDGIATKLISRNLPAFYEENPRIMIELQCSVEPAELLRLETDISIRFRRPLESQIIAQKVGTLHFLPYAATSYLDQFGRPRTPEDLMEHRLLDHTSYYGDDGDWTSWFNIARAGELVCYRCNSSMAFLEAVHAGVGVGLLPTYATDFIEAEPLDIGIYTYSRIWMCFHPQARRQPRVRKVIDWLKVLFQKNGSPWFRDKFYSPIPGANNADAEDEAAE